MSLFDPIDDDPPHDELRMLTKQQVKERLQRAVPKAIRALEDAMRNGETAETVKAAIAVLDRAGYGPKSTVQIEELPDDLSGLSEEQLAARAEQIAKALKQTVH